MNIKRIWIVSITVGLLSAPCIVLLKDTHPHLIAIPIILGTAICMLLEWSHPVG